MRTESINVLVTGANGFLGSHIILSLLQYKHVNVIAACRSLNALPMHLRDKARIGDLRDEQYRKSLVENVDVICHAGTWSSLWRNKHRERDYFYEPTIDLITKARSTGVSCFIMASTVVVASPSTSSDPIDDFATSRKTGFWPHLDYLIDIDNFMKQEANSATQMINMRLGHFVGAGNKLGIVPVLLPRLKTRLVPWLAGGQSRMPLIGGKDLGQAFALAVLANRNNLGHYESFNIVGDSCPSAREVIGYISEKSNVPMPLYNVSYKLGHGFAWLMETLFPVTPGIAPFLTRSIVHLAKDWYCTSDYARRKLGYVAQYPWYRAVDDAMAEIKSRGYAWPALMQKI